MSRDFPSRQTPNPGEIFLDHVGWYVPDLEAAGGAFARLGFRLTPYTAHANEGPDGTRVPSGTANRCAMLELGYLEILTDLPEIDTSMARQLRAGLARYQGLHLIAFTCADAVAEHARLAAEDFAPEPTVALRRALTLDDGSEGIAAFSVIRLPAGAMAEGRLQLLTQDTPDLVWQPSLIARDNAVDALSGIVICSPDPADTAARFARFIGRPSQTRDGRCEIGLDRGRVVICGRDEFTALIPGAKVPSMPFIGALTLRSRDLAASGAYLLGQGVRLTFETADVICIDAAEAAGAYSVIHAADAAWP